VKLRLLYTAHEWAQLCILAALARQLLALKQRPPLTLITLRPLKWRAVLEVVPPLSLALRLCLCFTHLQCFILGVVHSPLLGDCGCEPNLVLVRHAPVAERIERRVVTVLRFQPADEGLPFHIIDGVKLDLFHHAVEDSSNLRSDGSIVAGNLRRHARSGSSGTLRTLSGVAAIRPATLSLVLLLAGCCSGLALAGSGFGGSPLM
jgi:hypothetical protein